MQYKLRPYQQEAADIAVQNLLCKKDKDGIIIAPTGSGKSLIIAEIARQLNDKVLVLQPTKEILEQNFAKYLSYGMHAGIYSASFRKKQIRNVTFAMIGSIIRHKEDFEDFKYVLCDECHFVNPKEGMYKKFFNHVNTRICGLTATPIRLNTDGYGGSMLKFITRTRPRIFKNVLYCIQIKDLTEQGYLAQVKYKTDNIFDSAKVILNSTGADFDEESLKSYCESIHHNDRIVLAIKDNMHRRGIAVFVPFIVDAEYVVSRVENSVIVTGTTPKKEREQILGDFRKGKIKAIINVGIIDIGFDYPELDTIIIGKPTMSLARYYQQVGRAVRPHPDKEYALVVDLTDNYKRFGKVVDLTIHSNGNKPYISSNDKQLTNVYFDEFSTTEFVDMEMPFGKNKGKMISEIGWSYLKWLINECDLREPLKSTVKQQYRKLQKEKWGGKYN